MGGVSNIGHTFSQLRARAASIHAPQVRSALNPHAPPNNSNCSVAAALMGLRLIDEAHYPTRASGTQDAIDSLRRISSGYVDHHEVMSTGQLRKLFDKVGVPTRAVNDVDVLLEDLSLGRPAVVWGDARELDPWLTRTLGRHPVVGHFVVASGIDPATGKVLVNDPANGSGPTLLSQKRFRAFADPLVPEPGGETVRETHALILGRPAQ